MIHPTDRTARLMALKRFWTACESDDVSQIKSVYRVGFGQRLLFRADATRALAPMVRKNNADAVRSLLELGAEANEIPPYELTQCPTVEMFDLLGEFGLDFKERGGDFIHAFINDRAIFEWLLNHGVDINGNKRDISGGTGGISRRMRQGLRAAEACEVLNQAAAEGNVEVFDYLVSRGAQPARCHALHRLAECPCPTRTAAMVAHLVEKHNFDVNAEDGTGVQIFLLHGQPRLYSPGDGVPLRSALAHGNKSAVEALLRYGADPTAIVGHAIMERNLGIARILLEAGADASKAYKTAVFCNDLEAIQLCLDNGAELTEFEYMSEGMKGFLTMLR